MALSQFCAPRTDPVASLSVFFCGRSPSQGFLTAQSLKRSAISFDNEARTPFFSNIGRQASRITFVTSTPQLGGVRGTPWVMTCAAAPTLNRLNPRHGPSGVRDQGHPSESWFFLRAYSKTGITAIS